MSSIRREKILEGFQKAFLCLMGILLLWYLYSTATFNVHYSTPAWVHIARCLTAVMAVCLGKMWKERAFRFLAAFYLFMVIRLCFPHFEGFADQGVRESLLLGLWLFTACFGLASVLKREQFAKYITTLAVIWTIGMVLFSLIGLYSAWTRQTIGTIGGGSSWGLYGARKSPRLRMVYPVNTSGSMLGISAMIAACLLLQCRKKILKAAWFAALIIILAALSLTDSRTSEVVSSLGIGGMAGITLIRYIRNKYPSQRARAFIIGLLSTVIISAFVFLLIRGFRPFFHQNVIRGGLLIRSAGAETGKPTVIQQILYRNGDISRMLFSGREKFWNAVIVYLKKNPITLLYGTSVYQPMAGPNALFGYEAAHCHNTLLQILLESGIPGLCLMGGFLVTVTARGFRLINRKQVPFAWLCLIPAIVFAAWAGEMVECFIILFRLYTPQQAIVFILMGIICTYGKKEKAAVSPG